MLVQKLDTANNQRKAALLELADMSTAAQDALSGSQLDATEYTFFVSPNFTETGQFYNDLESALDDANLTVNTYLIIVLKGTYTGNFDVQGQFVYCLPGVEIKTTNKSFPVIEIGTNGKWLGFAKIIDNPTSGYAVELDDNTQFHFDTCIEDDNAINVVAIASGDVEIKGNRVGKIYSNTHELTTYVTCETVSEVEWADSGECVVTCKEFELSATVTAGTVRINADRFLAADTRLFDVSTGTLIAEGRLEDFDEAQNTTTGAGFPIIQSGGTIQLNNFFGYNAQGGIVFGSAGTLKLANSVLEAGSDGLGGTANTLYSPTVGVYTVTYNNATSLNTDVNANITVENVTGNKTVDAAVTI